VVASPSHSGHVPRYWPSARHFTEVIQCPSVCFAAPGLRNTLPAVDRLGMPIVTSGQFAYVYKLKSMNGEGDFAVRCFRGYLGDRDQRYRAIQSHVRAAPLPYLADFNYAPEGIMVGGQRFPILYMNWIEGPTLDLYVGEMLHRREVLLHLAAEWLRVINALRTSGMAHGDLQHGNVIVDHGQLTLIDHDGIFVPAMSGWSASEIGHQHFQHPQRTAQHFDASLDNFSAIVIYLSLLALAERPNLWAEHHDENLLFTKADFLDPAASSLFAKVRELGSECSQLADILATAASGPPSAVPSLLDLVQTSASRLPSWMTAPENIEPTLQTREVVQEIPAAARNIRWLPWDRQSKERPVPSTPSSPDVQSIFSTPTDAAVAAAKDPDKIARNAFNYAKETFQNNSFWWYWGFFVMFGLGGFGLGESFLAASLTVAIVCLIVGVYKAVEESRTARQKLLAKQQLSILPPRGGPASWQTLTHVYPLPPATKRTGPFLGNRVLGIYHQPDCDWVTQISQPNLISFTSQSDATSHGYKPCRICSPPSS
jgi:hypothetical protein